MRIKYVEFAHSQGCIPVPKVLVSFIFILFTVSWELKILFQMVLVKFLLMKFPRWGEFFGKCCMILLLRRIELRWMDKLKSFIIKLIRYYTYTGTFLTLSVLGWKRYVLKQNRLLNHIIFFWNYCNVKFRFVQDFLELLIGFFFQQHNLYIMAVAG